LTPGQRGYIFNPEEEKVMKKALFVISLSAVLTFSAPGQESKKPVQKVKPRVPAAQPALVTCIRAEEIKIERISIEPGKNAYIWPDDRVAAGDKPLWEFTKSVIQPGDTIWFRPGVHSGPLYAVDFSVVNAPLKRVHLRGAGRDRTTITGWCWVGANSTIKDLTFDNTGPDKNNTSLEIRPAGGTVEHVSIKGGRNGLISGGELFSEGRAGSLTLECVEVEGVLYNGILIGGSLGGKVNDCRLNHVSVRKTGNMGVEIVGDNAAVHDLSLSEIGTGGLLVNGANAQVTNSTLWNVALFGIGLEGVGPRVDAVRLKGIGTRDNGTGMIIYEESLNYSVTGSRFESMRNGLLIEPETGTLAGNTFSDIYNSDVIQTGGSESGAGVLDDLGSALEVPQKKAEKPVSGGAQAVSVRRAPLLPLNLAEGKTFLDRISSSDARLRSTGFQDRAGLSRVAGEFRSGNAKAALEDWRNLASRNSALKPGGKARDAAADWVVREAFKERIEGLRFRLAEAKDLEKREADLRGYVDELEKISAGAGKETSVAIKPIRELPVHSGAAEPVLRGEIQKISRADLAKETGRAAVRLAAVEQKRREITADFENPDGKSGRQIRFMAALLESLKAAGSRTAKRNE
jgi:hypothetical protein